MELFYIFDTIQNQAFTNSSIGYFHVNTSKAHYLLTKRALGDAKQLDRFIFVMRHINAPLSVAGSIDTVIDGKPLTLDGGFVLPQFAVFGIGRYQHYVSSHSSNLTTTNWMDYSISQPKVIVKGHSLSQAFCITVNDEQVYLFLLHMPPTVKQPKKLGVLNDEVNKTPQITNPKLKELEAIFSAEDTKTEK